MWIFRYLNLAYNRIPINKIQAKKFKAKFYFFVKVINEHEAKSDK